MSVARLRRKTTGQKCPRKGNPLQLKFCLSQRDLQAFPIQGKPCARGKVRQLIQHWEAKGDGSCYCHKPVAGKKNGGTQVFKLGNISSYYPTEEVTEKLLSHWKKPFCYHVRKLRDSVIYRSTLLVTAEAKMWLSWSSLLLVIESLVSFSVLNTKEICHCPLHQNWNENTQTLHWCLLQEGVT